FEETVAAEYSVKEPARCEETGIGVYTASFENEAFSTQTKEIELEALGHDYQFSSFLWTGNDEEGYSGASAEYICTHDESHKQTAEGTVEVQKTEPTCEEDGSVAYTASVTAENSIDGKAHTDPKTVVIPAIGHHYQEPEYVWTETDGGYEVTANTVCQNDSSHTLTETVQAIYEVVSEPACEHEGTGKYTAVFEHDAFSTQTKEITLEALGHDYQFSNFGWYQDGTRTITDVRAVYVCTHDKTHMIRLDAELTSVRTEPTCEEKGNIVYTALITAENSLDGLAHTQSRTTELAALGHSYNAPIYDWEETGTGYNVTGTAVCSRDETHVKREIAAVSYEVTKEPVCEMIGTGVYTAEFRDSLFTKQTKTVEIPAIGHQYDEPEYTWNKTEDSFTVTAKTVCQNDSSHVATETVTADFEMVDDPSQENKTGLYTAEFENELFETQTKIWTFVSGIQLDQTEVTVLSLDERITLHATVLPEVADNKAYHWQSSDETIAVIDENGVITPVSNGTTVVKAVTEEGTLEAECTVIVDIQTTGVEIDHTDYTVERGGTVQLRVIVTPEEANNNAVSWISSDSEVAAVDGNGLVTAVKSGTAVITAKTEDTGIEAECIIHVITSVQSVSLEESQISVSRGEKAQLHVEIEPADADNLKLNWKSSDETVATVDENGLVTAVERGEAVITVTAEDGGSSAECAVTVNVLVHSFTLNKKEQAVYIGETCQLEVVVSPEDADLSSLIWSSSNKNVAVVDEKGNVEALKKGITTITVKTQDDAYRATCLVRTYVMPTDILYESEYLTNNTMFLTPGDAVKLENITVLPEEASDVSLQFETSDPNVAKIKNDGSVYAVSAGKAVITISAGNISKDIDVVVVDDFQIPQNNIDLVNYIMNHGVLSDSNYYYGVYLDDNNEHYVCLVYYPEENKVELAYSFVKTKSSINVNTINVTYEYFLNDLTTITIHNNVTTNQDNISEVHGITSCRIDEVTLSNSLKYNITTVPTDLSSNTVQPLLDSGLAFGTRRIESILNNLGFSLNTLGFTSINVSEAYVTPAIVNLNLVDFIVTNGKWSNSNYHYSVYLDSSNEYFVSFQYYPEEDKIYLVYQFHTMKTSADIALIHVSLMYSPNDLSSVKIWNQIGTNSISLTDVTGEISCGLDKVTLANSLEYTVTTIPRNISASVTQPMLDSSLSQAVKAIEA
ncbi:MAG: Ig domain-containing protein, partial [Erysipelotrichaceae bacterium]|nr:Ig domain-containing protein [Erysipelotrichaceae bacterium]